MLNIDNNSSIKEQMTTWLNAVLDEYKATQMVKKYNRCNMRTNGISLLMRCQTEGIEEFCLVVATIKLDGSLQSKGWSKSFLNYCIDINPWDKLVIEDVNNLRFLEFCKKSGFKQVSDFFETSFVVDQKFIKSLKVKKFDS